MKNGSKVLSELELMLFNNMKNQWKKLAVWIRRRTKKRNIINSGNDNLDEMVKMIFGGK